MAALAFIRCPECNTVIEKPATGTPVCPNCGFGAPKRAKKSATKAAPATPMAPAPAPWAPAPTVPPSQTFSDSGLMMQKTSGMAIAALVVGIVSCCIWVVFIPVGPFLAVISGIVALVLGILAVRQVNRDPVTLKGRGLAVTGIVLGAIMVVIGLLLVVAVLVGLDFIEEYCADNPETEGCEDFNQTTAQEGPDILGLARLAIGPLMTATRLAMA